jgi:hypothetical protein
MINRTTLGVSTCLVFAAGLLVGCGDCYSTYQTYVVTTTLTGQANGPAALGLPAAVRSGQSQALGADCILSTTTCVVAPSFRASLAQLELAVDVSPQVVSPDAPGAILAGGPSTARLSDIRTGDEEVLEVREGTMALGRSTDRADLMIQLSLARASGDVITITAQATARGQSETGCTGD